MKGDFGKFLEQFEHENPQIQRLIRNIPNEMFNLLEKPNEYNGSFGHNFLSIMYATLFIDILKNLRKELKCNAGDLDLKLGYTVGYPMASFVNTQTNPTKKNVRIASRIFERMCILFPDETKRAKDQKGLDEYINVNEILERTLLLHGFNESANAIEEYQNKDDDSINKESISSQTSVIFNSLELVIENITIQFNEDETALDILKKIKENTDLEIEVYETLKEKVI